LRAPHPNHPADKTCNLQPSTFNQLAAALVALGCPPEKSAEMAAQLDKRARQLAEAKGRSYEEALAHLLGLMKQGWAAGGGSQ
jgi:hypothetical protein